MVLLVMVMLGVPNMVSAGQPSVQAPTGPQSGGVFTGTYTFVTYIQCSSGFNFNSSYSNNLEGTHTFAFYGAADGSLLTSIDGAGLMLVTSCGDPFTGPHTNVANYTVTKNSSPPPPTPTPTPPPTPTPAPPHTTAPTPGGGSGGITPRPTTSARPATGGSAVPTPTPAPGAAPEATPAPTPTPSPTASPAVGATVTDGGPAGPEAAAPADSTPRVAGAKIIDVAALAALISLIVFFVRSPRLRNRALSLVRSLGLRFEPYWFRFRQALHRRRPKVHGHDVPRRKGLAHHHHSGKVLAHHHTSYPALAFLIVLSAVLTAGVSLSTQAESSLLTLTVNGSPPSVAATIDQPADGDHFTVNSQTIRGTCPSGLGIEIYRNGSFAGSTLCDVNGLYAVLITLTPGANILVARDVDALGQYGPDSASITVYYDPPPTPSPTPTPSTTPTATPGPSGGATATPKPSPGARTPRPSSTPVPAGPAPVMLDSDRHFYQGAEVNVPIDWTMRVNGGRTPYRVSWNWGDGSSHTSLVTGPGDMKQSHQYGKPGTYQVTVRATDAGGDEAILQVVAVVNGPVLAPAGPVTTDYPGNLIYIWPLLILMSLAVLSFWLGERHKLSTAIYKSS